MQQINLLLPIIVDNFAGGGGTSTGIELATGRPVDIAINHDPDAIAMHKANHPYTKHYQESVWQIDPRQVCQGRSVGLAWFSPDCTHFSKAKGGKPVKKEIRGLAWIVLRWAGTVRPGLIILENVEEFQTWGPVRRGKPIKSKEGQTFRKFVSQLRDLGYDVEWRELVAADYGAPTTRKRFFLIARCDGKPIVWPERTHAPRNSEEVRTGKYKPWRSAAEIIDWSLPCPSIFDTKEKIKEKYGLKTVRPLAPNTMRRVARGLDKFVLKSANPFIVPIGYGERKDQPPRIHDIHEPLPTSVSSGKHYVADPLICPLTVTNTSNSVGHPADEPMDTARTGGGGGQMMVAPVLSAIGQTGGGDRGRDVSDPVHTTVSKQESCLISPCFLQYHTEQSDYVRGQSVDYPICTVDTANRYGMIAPTLIKYYGNDEHGQAIQGPVHTVTAKDREGLLSAHLIKLKGQEIGQDARFPLQTICAQASRFGVVQTEICKYIPGSDLAYWPQVRNLLNTYCGYQLSDDEIVLLWIGGIAYFIADIGLRMLTPKELYAANGFPPDYIIDRDYIGKPYTRSKQVARCGNAVPPPFAEALVRANWSEHCTSKRIDTMCQLHSLIAI